MRLIKFCIFLSVFNIFSANNSGLADMVGTKPTDSSTPSQSSTTAQASALSETASGITNPFAHLQNATVSNDKVQSKLDHPITEEKKPVDSVKKEAVKKPEEPKKAEKPKVEKPKEPEQEKAKEKSTKVTGEQKQQNKEQEERERQEKMRQTQQQEQQQREENQTKLEQEKRQHAEVLKEAEEQSVQGIIESQLATIESADEGNWVLKRIWWEQAEDTFGKIIALNDKIMQLQMQLVNDRNEFDKSIDQVFKELGSEQQEIGDLVNYMFQLSEQVTEDAADLIQEESEILNRIEEKKEELKNLQSTLDSLSSNDNLITESLMQLMNLVSQCREYEQKSWEDFKEIGRVLSDEKAKSLYYQIEANYKNVDAIYKHINGELSNFIHSTISKIDQDANTIKTIITQLGNDSFNIKNIVEAHKEAIEKKQLEKERKEQEALKPKKKIEKGFFGNIADWFSATWNSIKKFFGF